TTNRSPQRCVADQTSEEGVTLILRDLKSIDADRMTPLEALNRIYTWKDLLHPRQGQRSGKFQKGLSHRSGTGLSLFDEDVF
ncbi:MAG: hypothetical protein SNJ56_06130, partial [Termitinemataceae bacterium]